MCCSDLAANHAGGIIVIATMLPYIRFGCCHRLYRACLQDAVAEDLPLEQSVGILCDAHGRTDWTGKSKDLS